MLLTRPRSRFILLVLVVGCKPPASKAIARLTAASEVRLAERQRFEAMKDRDVIALDTLLDDELSYVRAGGAIQTRPEFIDAIKKQKIVYESITLSKVRVKVYDGLALATGRARLRVSSPTTGASEFGVRFTEVYVRRDGRWLLTVWEAARPLSPQDSTARLRFVSTKSRVFGFAAARSELKYWRARALKQIEARKAALQSSARP